MFVDFTVHILGPYQLTNICFVCVLTTPLRYIIIQPVFTRSIQPGHAVFLFLSDPENDNDRDLESIFSDNAVYTEAKYNHLV